MIPSTRETEFLMCWGTSPHICILSPSLSKVGHGLEEKQYMHQKR